MFVVRHAFRTPNLRRGSTNMPVAVNIVVAVTSPPCIRAKLHSTNPDRAPQVSNALRPFLRRRAEGWSEGHGGGVAMTRGVAGTGASIGAGTAASERVEIITRGEGRRSFSAEEKVRLVAETLRPSETVTAVSRRHGICASLLHRWRRAARGEVPSLRKARPQLLPVRVVAPDGAPSQPKPAPVPCMVPAPIEVVLRNGRVLRRRRRMPRRWRGWRRRWRRDRAVARCAGLACGESDGHAPGLRRASAAGAGGAGA